LSQLRVATVISITSAGEIVSAGAPPPYFLLIDRALRDEGTSHHHRAPAAFSLAEPRLIGWVHESLRRYGMPVIRGTTWTTDAPFRETRRAIRLAVAQGTGAVEMEAVALYAFARARRRLVICFAHVTNRLAQNEGDFEKGVAGGAEAALRLIGAVTRVWRSGRS